MNSTIVNNLLTTEAAMEVTASTCLGGNALVENNIIRQGPNSQNKITIAFSAEQSHPQWAVSSLVAQHNTIINAMALSQKPAGIVNFGTGSILSDSNAIYGLTPSWYLRQNAAPGGGTSTNDQFLATTPPTVDTSHPWSASTLDNIVSPSIGDDICTARRRTIASSARRARCVSSRAGGSDSIVDFGAGAGDVVQPVGTNFTSFAGAGVPRRSMVATFG